MVQPKPPSSLNLAGRAAILGLGILPAFAMGTIVLVLPAIADAFGDGTNGVQIKMVSTALGLGMFLGAPLGGLAADRFGRRNTLIAAVSLFGILGCGIMLMNALWPIILLRFIIGLAAGTMGVAIAAVVGDHFEDNARARWIGFGGAVATAANFIVAPLTGMLVDIGWRYAFSIYAFAFVVLVTVLLGIPRGIAASARADVPGDSVEALTPSRLPVSALVLAVILGTLATGASLYWPFRLREMGVESSQEMAYFALPNILFISLAAFGYGWVRKRLSIAQVFLVGAVASCAGLIAMSVAKGGAMMALGLSIEGLGIGLLTPNLTVYALALSPPHQRGRNVGFIKGMVFGSPFLTQFALEPMTALGGAAWPLLGIAVMSGVFALAVMAGKLGQVHNRPVPV